MSFSDGLTIRAMRREELHSALDLAADEGWNPGLHDADPFFAADPEGFLAAVLDGRMVGCISAVRHGRDFGFLGLFLVLPEFRGRGIGTQLWRAGMDRLTADNPHRNVGLDGVPARQEDYRRAGFERAYRSVRFRAESPRPGAERSPQAVDLSEVDHRTLMEYDRACFPGERETFLDAWFGAPGTRALAWLDDGWLAGFGSIRPCREGWKVGPLFADHRRAAEGLLDALCLFAGSGPIFLDVAEPHAGALGLAAARSMVRVFETSRMYTRGVPDVDAERVWGVTSFELG